MEVMADLDAGVPKLFRRLYQPLKTLSSRPFRSYQRLIIARVLPVRAPFANAKILPGFLAHQEAWIRKVPNFLNLSVRIWVKAVGAR
jgi:hypothetical protein